MNPNYEYGMQALSDLRLSRHHSSRTMSSSVPHTTPRGPDESLEDYARRLERTVASLQFAIADDGLSVVRLSLEDEDEDDEHHRPVTMRQVIVLFVVLIGINLAGAYIFRAAELNKELRRARQLRLDKTAKLGRVLNPPNGTPLPLEDQMFVIGVVDASATTSWKCGLCPRGLVLAKDAGSIIEQSSDADSDFRLKWSPKICRHSETSLRHCEWKWLGSFFFTITVVTTIGYGSFVPVTTVGKVWVVVFVFFGSQVAFLLYTSIGAQILQKLQRIGRLNDHLCKLMCLILVLYTVIGGFLFNWIELDYRGNEEFTFWNSMYFVVQTLMTLGLGDLTPDIHRVSLATAWVYIIFGLAILGAAMSTITEQMLDVRARIREMRAEVSEVFSHVVVHHSSEHPPSPPPRPSSKRDLLVRALSTAPRLPRMVGPAFGLAIGLIPLNRKKEKKKKKHTSMKHRGFVQDDDDDNDTDATDSKDNGGGSTPASDGNNDMTLAPFSSSTGRSRPPHPGDLGMDSEHEVDRQDGCRHAPP